MVSYGFKAMFAPKILDGTKRQTIRADRKRHARPGEELQLYTGMRTKQCRLVARATCEDVRKVTLSFCGFGLATVYSGTFGATAIRDLDRFARSDGFEDWDSMRAFWRKEHDAINEFEGVLITWMPLG